MSFNNLKTIPALTPDTVITLPNGVQKTLTQAENEGAIEVTLNAATNEYSYRVLPSFDHNHNGQPNVVNTPNTHTANPNNIPDYQK